MSESTPEGTTAEDLQAGGAKPGGDYGDIGGIGTAAEDEAGGRPDRGATPDEPEAAQAQEGVQAAFE